MSTFRRDSANVARRLKKSKAGILLTHKGQDDLVVQSVESYEAMLDRIDLLESANEIRKGLAEYERGEGEDAMPALLKLGRELGIYPAGK